MYGTFHGLSDLTYVNLKFDNNKITDLDSIFKGLQWIV